MRNIKNAITAEEALKMAEEYEVEMKRVLEENVCAYLEDEIFPLLNSNAMNGGREAHFRCSKSSAFIQKMVEILEEYKFRVEYAERSHQLSIYWGKKDHA